MQDMRRLGARCGAAAERAAAGGAVGARTWLFSSTVPIFGFEEASCLAAVPQHKLLRNPLAQRLYSERHTGGNNK